ncbi:MAG: hypothetical protein AUK64_2416, partial [bacterium P201]
SQRDNSYLAGPSPCPCPGVDTSARACSLPGFYALKLSQKIAILLIIKGIAIAFVKYYDYICVGLKQIKY